MLPTWHMPTVTPAEFSTDVDALIAETASLRAWAAYSRAWPEAMAGETHVDAGFRRIEAMISSMNTQGVSAADVELLALALQAVDANASRAQRRLPLGDE
jgi:hypothetical protein